MVVESAELQIVGSEGVSEATEYVSESGDERNSDDNEELINSRDIFQKQSSRGICCIFAYREIILRISVHL